MVCRVCNKEVSEGVMVCPYCGASMSEAEGEMISLSFEDSEPQKAAPKRKRGISKKNLIDETPIKAVGSRAKSEPAPEKGNSNEVVSLSFKEEDNDPTPIKVAEDDDTPETQRPIPVAKKKAPRKTGKLVPNPLDEPEEEFDELVQAQNESEAQSELPQEAEPVAKEAEKMPEPVADEPICEEPTVPEELYEEVVEEYYEAPVVVEAVYEEPVTYSEPVLETPTVAEPTVPEELYEEVIEEYYEAPTEETVYEEPIAYTEPLVEEPMADEPAYEEPIAEEPAYEEPIAEEPVNEEPIAEAPVYIEPVAETPVYIEPVADAQGEKKHKKKKDKANFFLAFLSFFFPPYLGILLWVSGYDKKPRAASHYGACAFIGYILRQIAAIVIGIALVIAYALFVAWFVIDSLQKAGYTITFPWNM